MQISTNTQTQFSFLPHSSGLNSLQSSLKTFGLNPNDWILVENQNNTYFIENKNDPDFRFVGKINPKVSFENISLISL